MATTTVRLLTIAVFVNGRATPITRTRKTPARSILISRFEEVLKRGSTMATLAGQKEQEHFPHARESFERENDTSHPARKQRPNFALASLQRNRKLNYSVHFPSGF
ncbi:hypothetical protein CEXT_458721 [Caerostris extrusa]|uniref:Secreted protein n=1 Tax=Caerostris extrusa TaxID=172846 RepID=A0AAV4UHI4_CAEEX|nr:hypothetical protein CEXT_458721 [Caerostris extrusa]